MIQKLQRKFVAIAISSVAAVLLVLMATINLMNYYTIEKSSNATMQILYDNDGSFPERNIDQGLGTGSGKDTLSSSRPAPPSGNDFQARADFRSEAERPFNTRYFTVTMDAKGEVINTDVSKIAAISTSEAESYGKDLYEKGKEKGYVDDYKYSAKTLASGNTVYIFLDCTSSRSSFRHFLFISVLVSLLGLAAVLILVVLLSRRAVKPIAESYEKQKQFITDASHEIKTPLAIIRANTEVLEMTDCDNKWIKSTQHQIDRLTQLTEKLVFLSRMDEENNPMIHMAEFNLSEAVEDTLEGYASLCQSKGRVFRYEVDPDLQIYGDEAMIRQMVSLLMDNAVKYSNENGEIHCRLTGKSHRFLFQETNTVKAGSILPGPHPEFFHRFYRADASRNSKAGSFGIGLSVVEAIVKAHKGHVFATSSDGNSVTFQVEL